MLWKESQVLLKKLSQLIFDKLKEPVFHVRGWIKGEIVIEFAQLYSRMLCGDCLIIPLWEREPDWESGCGLGLAQ